MKNILFVCIENSNRSQMAQAFATIYGSEKVKAYSSGSKPSGKINPKAIAAMGELGYDLSINRCTNGMINNGCRTDSKPSAFSSTLNYYNDTQRKSVYDAWTKIINLRVNNEVFNTKTFNINSTLFYFFKSFSFFECLEVFGCFILK